MAGYIKLHRQLLDSYQFSNPNNLKIWLWMLLKAAHKPRVISMKVSQGYTDVELQRGQLVFGRNKASIELNLEESMIYRVIKKFQNQGSIDVKSNNQYTIITICKYDSYNPVDEISEQPVNSQRTTDEQPVNTYNNDKKVKNVKNNIVLSEFSSENQTEPKVSINKWIETFEDRKKKFRDDVGLFLRTSKNPSGYPREMLNEFFDWWTEPNKSKSRMKWETQKTWELAMRLSYWDRRSQVISTPKANTPQYTPVNKIDHSDLKPVAR